MINNILIVGCGLIGSSVLRAASSKKAAKKIYVYEKSKKNISIIKKIKNKFYLVDKLENISINFDLIILCTPMSEYLKIIPKINKFISNNTIITDVGSTKEIIYKNVKKNLKKKTTWIPSHPISGSEVSGPKFGDKNLFKNKWCIIIKEKNINKKHLSKLKNFWIKLGSSVVMMNCKKHDIIFSMTSHLPHLIAYNLIKTATSFEKEKKYSLIKYSAGGLRDFSRIAASNEIMWRDIFFSNSKNIISTIDLFVKNLNIFKKDIKSKKSLSLSKKLISTKKVRQKIISLKQDINKPDFGRF